MSPAKRLWTSIDVVVSALSCLWVWPIAWKICSYLSEESKLWAVMVGLLFAHFVCQCVIDTIDGVSKLFKPREMTSEDAA